MTFWLRTGKLAGSAAIDRSGKIDDLPGVYRGGLGNPEASRT